MKKIILTLITCTLLLNSCDDQLDINQDPDRMPATNLPLNLQLPVAIAGVASVQGSNWAIIGGIWSQMFTQNPNNSQYTNIDSYGINSTSEIINSGWFATYDALQDIRSVKTNAFANKNWNYYLIATVLEAYTFQVLTDWFGDVPYTESNNILITQPKFDDSEFIYQRSIANLNEVLAINRSTSQGILPAEDDLIFNGNMDNWVKFANTLKLKLFLRQTEARPDVARTGILEMLDNNVNFLDTDAAMGGFSDAPNLSNPFYETDRRQLNTKQNLSASSTLYSFLDTNNDERIATFYGTGAPLNQGDFNTEDRTTAYSIINLNPLSNIYLISEAHSYFMQAEALERYKNGNQAKSFYDRGVRAAFIKSPNFYDNSRTEDEQTWEFDTPFNAETYIVDGGAYQYPSSGNLNEKLTSILTQKWIASFPDNGAEAFFEWQRTGIPNTSAVAQSNLNYIPGQFTLAIESVLGNTFPQRLVYPNSELTRNANAPSLISITTPIWWNK